eukprot:CAMPEP_0201545770 /NCGR_PEP_ID=MMETSP0173_2-20130828/2197_1 /ASSEMBLY_ACC=CAM_ASM_000268 /TAXON_ID=218659 /ORGANISM="Vexillifera sp., Strain DIVA3 564/2" /LENGTH=645 /DNA_ID=CAMNT_0047954261 /DNA_START=29 /DNA_END=1966 /DNA_ORIENTATION=-
MASIMVTKKAEKEGYLEKNGRAGAKMGIFGRMGWKKRWIAIVEHELRYFEKKVQLHKNPKAQGSIPLQNIVQVCGGKLGASRTSKDHGFTVLVETAKDERTYQFAGSNDRETEEWVTAILDAQLKALKHYGTKFLRMNVMCAKNLPAADSGGTSDPYAIVKIEKKQYKTETISKNCNPEWNEQWTWILPNASTQVWVEVWDWDRIGKDNFLGKLKIPITELSFEEHVAFHTLQGSSAEGGTIQLGLRVGGLNSGALPEVDPIMDFYLKYVKRDASGAMVVQRSALPQQWQDLFARAGLDDDGFKDPNLVSELLTIMNNALKNADKLESVDTKSSSGRSKRQKRKLLCKARALYDFEAQQDGDLAIKKGDVISVFKKDDPTAGWWYGKVGNKEGIFPGNYVEEMRRKKKPSNAKPAPPKKALPDKPLPDKPTGPAPAPPSSKTLDAPPGKLAVSPPSDPAPPVPTDPAPPVPTEPAPIAPVKTPTHPAPKPPSQPTAPAPQPPAATTPAPATTTTTAPAATTTTAPAAPTPPPAAPTPPPAAPKAPAAPAAPKAPTAPAVAASSTGAAGGGKAGLLGAIQGFNSGNLKKAEERKLDDLNDKQMNGLVGLLAGAISGRRDKLRIEDGSGSEGDSDDGWGTDDDDDWE